MRVILTTLALASLAGLAACGGAPETRTVVVNPAPAATQGTVVVPSEGAIRRCPVGATVC